MKRPSSRPIALNILGGLVPAVIALLLAACGSSSSGSASDDATLRGEWVLQSYQTAPGVQHTPLPSTTIRLTITATEVRGNTGCNSYGGTYTVTGRTFRVTNLRVTLIGCPAPIAAQEQAYLTSLGASTSYAVSQGTLVLSSAGPWTELRFRAASAGASSTP
jgi:heat shock protein HslJ